MEPTGLYIHIPFCEKKCYYCDFTSVTRNNKLEDKYIKYLIKEIKILGEYYKDCDIETIFIGGGTPSLLHHNVITNLIKEIKNNFNINMCAEISIEVNPETITEEKASSYVAAGINRVSMGIQSMNDNILKLIGRIHDKEKVYSTTKLLRKAGFGNINGDIIFGLPHESIYDFANTLSEVINLDLEHISMYGLMLEENVLLDQWSKKGLVKMPTEEEEREMYHMGKKILYKSDYKQYEISNFSKVGYQCKHNLRYWKLKPYLGVGLSSHSSIEGKRYWNHTDFNLYYKNLDQGSLPILDCEIITPQLEEAEYLILAIRLNEGIIIKDFERRFNCSFMGKYGGIVDKHIESGLLYSTNDVVALTEKGMDLSNQVEIDFLP